MSSLPYFPFYPSDWLSSPRIICSTLVQQGAYIRLLSVCWLSGDCSLPNDSRKLSMLSGLQEQELEFVYQMFTPHPRKEGHLTNDRLLKEWERAHWISEKRSQAGKKSGKVRRTYVQHMHKQNMNKNGTCVDKSESDSESDINTKKEEVARQVSKKPTKPTLTDDEWLGEIKNNPAYAHIDFSVQIGKMEAWLSLPQNKHRIKSRKFILNWLNRVEKPVQQNVEPSKSYTGTYHKKVQL